MGIRLHAYGSSIIFSLDADRYRFVGVRLAFYIRCGRVFVVCETV